MSGSQRSLAKGSAAPGPVPQGLIRLYSMRFCPFAQRARLVLVAKGIKHEVVNINLLDKPDWFFERSPLGLVPSIDTSDGKIIYESLIVCEYLDEAFPGVKLIPSDPYAKAEQKMLLETFSPIIAIFYKIVFALKKKEDTTDLKSQFLEKFTKLEEALVKKNTPYFGSKSVSFIDYMVWPWFERFSGFGLKDLLDKTPNIKAWQDRMLQDPAVKATFTEPEALLEFFKLYSQDSLEAVDYGLN
ncbi:PREDICTED: glutathione S-transferase omega-1-like [Nanorana parkeri]|uniref:glutathione S-transferase omega-1-like n=1 Tax=Nanorana parkeri TaxID=125878 RepID=UPI000854655D|nr:PREDICTED: glutathione S-transferase omega-1-like [Nanorana parkeri]